MRTGTYILSALAAAGSAMAHMEMNKPYAIRSKFNPDNSGGNIDYSNTSPLSASGSDFPCKGYHTDPFKAVTTYDAGSSYTMSVTGSATHSGGSCQLSLSYDKGKTFKVIQSYMGDCPLKSDWDFTIPANAPSGDALFSWSWFNLVGNREMYHNCAFVTINGGNGGSLDSLPDMFAANVGNGCTTAERETVIFANPGENVDYAGDASPQSPVAPQCSNNVPTNPPGGGNGGDNGGDDGEEEECECAKKRRTRRHARSFAM